MIYNKVTYEGRVLIDLTGDSVIEEDILEGDTAHDRHGDAIVGTMPDNSGFRGEIETKNQEIQIPKGYHDGAESVSIKENAVEYLHPENVKKGIEILGVVGTEKTISQMNFTEKTVVSSVNSDQVITPISGVEDGFSKITVRKIPYKEEPNSSGGITVIIG